ncbi:hypothetical protein A5714_14045 [Mycobacterium sp. E2462]|nr:hypothetical protein A5714_14045 [Mycobacterium sp. E2462]
MAAMARPMKPTSPAPALQTTTSRHPWPAATTIAAHVATFNNAISGTTRSAARLPALQDCSVRSVEGVRMPRCGLRGSSSRAARHQLPVISRLNAAKATPMTTAISSA